MTHENGKVTGVDTTAGHIKADYVVNCAGMWARQLGELSGVNIPNQAAEHYYLITDKMEGLDPNLPVIEVRQALCSSLSSSSSSFSSLSSVSFSLRLLLLLHHLLLSLSLSFFFSISLTGFHVSKLLSLSLSSLIHTLANLIDYDRVM